MSGEPCVSVVIAFLNAGRFIGEAVGSVLAQSYDDWELLLVDDGSADASTAIARQYTERHPGRVRYLEHPGHMNRGVSAARNLGICHARGRYVALLDADDVWLPRKLAEQVAILDAHPEAAMVYGLSRWWYSWTGIPEDQARDFMYELGVPPNTLIKPPASIPLYFLRQVASLPNISSMMLRRELVERIKGFEEGFQSIYAVYEDQAFCAKVCLNAAVFASPQCWDFYRQHPYSAVAVASRNGQQYAARLYFLNWLAGYLADYGIKDRVMLQALHTQRWLMRHPVLHRLLKGE